MFGVTFKHWRADVPASVVVFLVAMPLCLGIALASGATPLSGIVAGIVGGVVVGTLSGSQLGVSGPAAGLAVIVLTAIQELKDYRLFLVAVMLAGAIQILLGVARAGIVAYYFPSTVIKGMLAAIGIILILKQIPHAFGYDGDYEGDESFLQKGGENTLTSLLHSFDKISPGALLVALIGVALLLLWERPFIKSRAFAKVVPGPLIAVAVGIFLAVVLGRIDPRLAISAEHMVSVPVFSSLRDATQLITFPDFNGLSNPAVYKVAVTLAIVASIETLLSVEAIDKIDPHHRVTPSNQELRAQGVGNLVSGFLGGLPVTQVIVRSSANLNSGGQTKLSAIIHGVFMLVAVLVFPTLINMIPLAALAAVLLLVGYKLAKVSLFLDMYRKGHEQFLPFVITVVVIVFSDLLTGVAVGMAVAIFFVLKHIYLLPFHLETEVVEGRVTTTIALAQEVSFLNRGRILHTLTNTPDGTSVILDLTDVVFIDPDVLDVIESFREGAKERDIEVTIIPPTKLARPVATLFPDDDVVDRTVQRVAS